MIFGSPAPAEAAFDLLALLFRNFEILDLFRLGLLATLFLHVDSFRRSGARPSLVPGMSETIYAFHTVR